MEDPKVKELAATLRKKNLAVSDYEAREKAKAILGIDIQNKETEPEKGGIPQVEPENPKEGFLSHLKEKIHHEKKPEIERSHPDYGISREDLTVNDLMKEVGVNPEEIPEDKEKIEEVEEKISELKKEIFEEEQNPEPGKMEDIKHKMEDIKEEVKEAEEEKQDKKVDLDLNFDSSEKIS